MKQLYYFSGEKFQQFDRKKVKITVAAVIFLFATSFIINMFSLFPIIFPDSDLDTVLKENHSLKNKVKELAVDYKNLNKKVSGLFEINDELRLAANLPPVSDKNLGVGGSVFKKASFNISSDIKSVLDGINAYVEQINYKVNFELENYNEIKKTFSNNDKLFNCIPAIRPVEGGFGDRFGMRMHPILKVRRMHNGLDILANRGEPVYATGDGKVRYAGRKGGLGKAVVIDHGFGYRTLYGHLSKIKVKKWKKVKRGDLIGYSGDSGLSTGPHLHYEVRHNGIALNPRNFIFDDVKLFDIVKK